MTEKPIQKVFRQRTQRLGFVLRNRIGRFHGWDPHYEPVRVFVHDGDADSKLIQFERVSDPRCWIEYGNVLAAGTANTRYGEETVLKAQDLGAVTEMVDNRTGYKPIDVDFSDLFSKTDTKDTKKSGGTSTKISLDASEGIEGFGSIKESITSEVHAEFAESEGSSVQNTRSGDEGTIVPVGKRIQVTETRKRADTQLVVHSDALFGFSLKVGSHDPRWNHGWKKGGPPHKAYWQTWQDFCDSIKGEAADNIDLAENFQKHPAHRYDLSVLDPLDGRVRYTVKFEGKIIKDYAVHGVLNDGSLVAPPKDESDG